MEEKEWKDDGSGIFFDIPDANNVMLPSLLDELCRKRAVECLDDVPTKSVETEMSGVTVMCDGVGGDFHIVLLSRK